MRPTADLQPLPLLSMDRTGVRTPDWRTSRGEEPTDLGTTLLDDYSVADLAVERCDPVRHMDPTDAMREGTDENPACAPLETNSGNWTSILGLG